MAQTTITNAIIDNHLLSLLEECTSYPLVEKKLGQIKDNDHRAHLFSRFCQAYLAMQPLYQVKIFRALSALTKHPTVIPERDFIGAFESKGGSLHAYRVIYQPHFNKPIHFDLQLFSEQFPSAYGRLIITNAESVPLSFTSLNGNYAITRPDLMNLSPLEMSNITRWLRGDSLIVQPTFPYPHQQEAIKRLQKGFKHYDRLTLVMACGSGKSLIPLWVAEQAQYQRVIVFVPTLALLRQFFHGWLKTTTNKNLACIAVCSDETTVQPVETETTYVREDLGFPVTTVSSDVTDFLSKTQGQHQLVFTTYQSAHVVAQALKRLKKKSFDFGVFDEAHRTAGIDNHFSFALDNDHIRINKRLFMTATPRHVDIRREKEIEEKVFYSMDNQDIFGPIIHRLSFAEAVTRDIICPYKIIISVVTREDLNRYHLLHGLVHLKGKIIPAHELALYIAIKKAVETYDIRKVLTFHHSIKQAKNLIEPHGIQLHIPHFKTLHVNGKMSTSLRHQMMDTFSHASHAILSNARCLTEGIDVPVVDMVAFVQTRHSVIDIVQAAGRAMRKLPGKQRGYILLPVFLDQGADESLEEAIEHSDFEDVWSVLNALSEQDEALRASINAIKRNQDKEGEQLHRTFSNYVDVLGSSISFKMMAKAITLRSVARVGDSFESHLEALKLFKEVYGHCNVPSSYPPCPTLRNWTRNIRRFYKKGFLSRDKVQRLEALGFFWSQKEYNWQQQYHALIEFKTQHGHCCVPKKYSKNPVLVSWVLAQRQSFKIGKLTPEKIKALNALEFSWDIPEEKWKQSYQQLQAFYEKHGHCFVSPSNPQYYSLSMWINKQREDYTKKRLSPNKIQRLEALGFIWKPLDKKWEINYQLLKAFKNRYGHLEVPYDSLNKSLQAWLVKQRQKYKKGQLPPEQINALTTLGVSWNFDDKWEIQFRALVAFYKKEGHCNIPPHSKNPRLKRWVMAQRVLFKKGQLSQKRIRQLKTLPFDLEPYKSSWEQQFKALKAFKGKYGHCQVPGHYPPCPSLHRWVAHQRQHYKNKKRRLSPEKIKALTSLDFDWTTRKDNWEERYQALFSFYQKEGHCNIPCIYPPNPSLGKWIRTQRARYKKGLLHQDKIQRLESLGFVWNVDQHLWQSHYQALKLIYQKEGHCNIPCDYPPNPTLGNWIQSQRQSYKKGILSQDKIQRLEALDFIWDINQHAWQSHYQTLKAFKTKYGHCRLPAKYPENPSLYNWITAQRDDYRKHRLSPKKIQLLNTLGFKWKIKGKL